MTSQWKHRLAKYIWAKNNPEKQRQANRRWEALHPDKIRRQARLRMRRFRNRRHINLNVTELLVR